MLNPLWIQDSDVLEGYICWIKDFHNNKLSLYNMDIPHGANSDISVYVRGIEVRLEVS